MAGDAIWGGAWRCEDASRWQETLSGGGGGGGAWRCEDASRWQETLSGLVRAPTKPMIVCRSRVYPRALYAHGGEY